MARRHSGIWAAFLLLSGCAASQDNMAGMTQLERVSLRIDTFNIEVASNGEVLWQGLAKVNRMTPARYSTKAEVAAGPECLPMLPARFNSYTLTVQVNKYGGNVRDPDAYKFVASIERSDLTDDCRATQASEVRVEKVMRMRRGQRVELRGDNGFRVTIFRQ